MDIQEAVFYLEKHVGKHKFVQKDESVLMKILSVVLWVFNREFMTRYTTAFFGTIYTKVGYDPTDAQFLQTLLHEDTHGWDEKRMGKFSYTASYLSPQIFSLLGLLGFLGFLWWPLFLVFSLFLLACPIPSKPRCWIESRGYAMNVLCSAQQRFGMKRLLSATDEELFIYLKPIISDYYERVFPKPGYYFMGYGMKERVEAMIFLHALGVINKGQGKDYPPMKLFRSMTDEDWEGLFKAKTFGKLYGVK